MSKRISIELVKSSVCAVAELLDSRTPKTCAAMWNALKSPLETKAMHGVWTGRSLEIDLPEQHRLFNPESIPLENATTTPMIGDILWEYLPKGRIRSLFGGAWNIIIAYGPESVMRTPLGPQPSNVWAQITECDPTFYQECAKQWFGKAEQIRIKQIT